MLAFPPALQSPDPHLSWERDLEVTRNHRPSRGILDLRSVTTTGDTDADVQASELVQADDEEGLVDLEIARKTSASSLPKINPVTAPLAAHKSPALMTPPRPTPNVLRRGTVFAHRCVPSFCGQARPQGEARSRSRKSARTLVRRIAGSTSCRGLPLTRIRPLPVLH